MIKAKSECALEVYSLYYIQDYRATTHRLHNVAQEVKMRALNIRILTPGYKGNAEDPTDTSGAEGDDDEDEAAAAAAAAANC